MLQLKRGSFCCAILLAALLPNKSYSQDLPLDTAVHTGKLANGFTYFIRRNTEPKNRVVMYLANKVGSIQEDEDQRGLAHMLEHMSFNGSTHYPKNELVEYLEKSGVRFGADLNAYTNFDETVYQLPLPSDDTSLLRHGLQIMRDWAAEATLDPTEIDKERGVVLEEKRLHIGAQERTMNAFLPLEVNHSRYADRLPIGTEKVLNGFTPATLRRFYSEWYRPNLQALIVVGDIDVKQMEAAVKHLFSDLKNPAKERPRVKYTIPLTGRNQYLAITDPEQTALSLDVLIKQPGTHLRTKADYRASIVTSLMDQVFSERLRELTMRGNPPFVKASAGLSEFMGGLNAFGMSLVPKSGQLEDAFKMVWTEVVRMKTYGVTDTELERAKKNYLRNFKLAIKEKDKTPSQSYVGEYLNYFLKQDAAPGIEAEYKLVQELLPQIKGTDVLALAKRSIKSTDRDIMMVAPEKEKATLPTEATVNNWIAAVEKAKLEPWKDENSNEGIMKNMPVAGKVTARSYNDSVQVSTFTLSNGVKVLVKPTTFKNDQVLFMGYSEGGTSVYDNRDYLNAANAAGLIAANGVGNLDPVALSKQLTGKSMQVQPYIQERYQGVSGGATPADLETALQLMYMYFTAPRIDTAIFKGIVSRSKTSIEGKSNNPEAVFSDTVSYVLGNRNFRRLPITVDRLDSLDLNRMLQIYRERFANAGAFTFVFTGNIDTTTLIPLIEKYIGSLPAGKAETARNLGIHIPEGRVEQTVYRGTNNKAIVDLFYSGEYEYNGNNNMQLSALGNVLQYHITERIREAEGGAYSPRAGVNYTKLPDSRYSFSVQITCAPANVDKLVAATNEEINKLKTQGPSADDVQKFLAEQRRSVELQMQDNQFWLQYLVNHTQLNESMTGILHLEERLQAVTPASVQKAAQQYFDGKNYTRLVLMPEK
jgi:zinc protease